jgi:transposase-like protein
MVGHGTKYSRKKDAAIAALLTQRNIEEAARVAGIGTQTLYRWMKDPGFDAAYRAAKHAAYGQATARLHQGSSAAAATMLKIMLDSTAPAASRLKAADCVLNHVRSAIEMEQIIARIAALEEAAELVASQARPKAA